jgi:hypothetical protein
MTILRKYLPLLIIILLISCNKNAGNKKEYIPEQNIVDENRTAELIKAEQDRVKKIFEQYRIDRAEFEEKMSGNTIAAEIALTFADSMPSGGTGGYYSSSKTENVSEIDVIIPAQGYYIQQLEGYFIYGRSPEILVLSVEGENVYIREIDLVNGQIITRNEILLQFDGETFAHNRTKLETQNGKIQIIYSENIPEQPWLGPFDYKAPYIYAGNLDEPINDNVRKLTSDYIKTFTGYYVFDSSKVIKSNDKDLSLYSMRDDALKIEYNQKLKCLTLLFGETLHINHPPNDFIETDNKRIIYWIAGEGAGYTDVRFYFYKGGIAYTRDHSSYRMTDDGPTDSEYEKYVVFFRKEE